MNAPLFVDISHYQTTAINWKLYLPWSAAADGIARLSIRASIGTGSKDDHYDKFLADSVAEARALAIPLEITHYHFAYPNLNSADAEADWHFNVVGDLAGRPNDTIMLDLEVNVPEANASWTLEWCRRIRSHYNGRRPTIYASKSYAQARLQDARLPVEASYTMADWTFDPNARPSCPLPWTKYENLQWTDHDANVPGIPSAVDADIFLGGALGGDYAGAMWLPSPNFWSGNSKTYVVIHGTASNGPQTGYQLATSSEFTDGKTASVHYINDRDASPIYQIVREHDSAWGNCCVTGNACPDGVLPTPGSGDCHDNFLIPGHNYNGSTISIENVKHSSDNSEGLTTVQYQKLVALVHDICKRNNIPMKKATDASGGIIGHFDLDPVNRARCPGNFPWAQFIKDVQAGGADVLPTGWKDDGTTLVAKNGVAMVHGFRAEVMNASVWDSDDVPNEAEKHVDQVLFHRVDLGAGQIQTTRDHLLWYTAARGVIDEKEMGLEIFLRDQKIADLEAQLAAGGGPSAPPDTSALKADLDAVMADVQKAEDDLANLK